MPRLYCCAMASTESRTMLCTPMTFYHYGFPFVVKVAMPGVSCNSGPLMRVVKCKVEDYAEMISRKVGAKTPNQEGNVQEDDPVALAIA